VWGGREYHWGVLKGAMRSLPKMGRGRTGTLRAQDSCPSPGRTGRLLCLVGGRARSMLTSRFSTRSHLVAQVVVEKRHRLGGRGDVSDGVPGVRGGETAH